MLLASEDVIPQGTQPQIVGSGYGFTEGPAADARGNIYFSDGQNDSIYFYEIGKPVVRFADDATDAIGMMVNGKGELCVCEGAAHRVVAINLRTKEKRVLCNEIDGIHFNEPNDLAIDHDDGFYFSDPLYQHRGQPQVMREDTYYCSPEGEVTRVSTAAFKPNGVVLTPDGRYLFLADARGQRIFRYDVRGPGHLTREILWIDGLAANPDGMTLDEHGNLYVCCGKGGLKIFSPDPWSLGTVRIEGASNCCFGGPEFRTLFVTAGDKFLAIPTNVVGIKPPPLL